MPIEPFDFTYTLTSQASENEVLNALGKTRVKEFEPKSYFFTESSLPAQANATGSYGPDGTTKFNITTQFDLANKKAYAVTSGQVLIVLQSGAGNEAKVNVFIKPLSHIDVGVPIKYYVYRGLKKESFIDVNNNILIRNTTTNTPFMTKVWDDLIYFNNLTDPYPAIPATLFGYTTTDTADTRLDAKFFNVVEDTTTDENKIYNLANIEAGQHFGEFADNTGGFEIVLNDGFYYQEKSDTGFEFDMTYAKKQKVTLDIADIAGNPTILEKIYRENVQNFLDPAAFYGAHITEKENGEIKVVDTAAKYSSKEAIYRNIVSKFYNKHKSYFYIQCNRGRSFNFDGILGTEPLKIGVSETVSPSLYQTNGWPIIISEFEQTHATEETDAKKGVNNLSFQLKFKTINKNVTLYNSYGNCANETLEGNFLTSKALVDETNIATQDYTNTVKYKLTNNYNLGGNTSLTTKGIASFIYINHEEKEVDYFNDFFGPINIEPLIKVNEGISNSVIKKASNKKLKLKSKDGILSVYNQELVINGKVTASIPSSLSEDSRTRLYVLKKLDSIKISETKSNEYMSSSDGYSYANTKEDYNAYIYGDKSYTVWKGKIGHGAGKINTLQLINFEQDTNTTDFIQLGLTEVDFNKLIYNSEEIIENSTHIPADATNIFFHLDDSGIVQTNTVYKKYKLGVKYLSNNVLMFSFPTDVIDIYTIDGLYFFTKRYSEKFEFAEEFGIRAFYFVTKTGYNGEFGFDRLKTGDVPGETSYEDSIISGYEEKQWTGTSWNTQFDSPDEAFQALKKEYINIKTQVEQEIYYVPFLNIFPSDASTTGLPSTVELNVSTSSYGSSDIISYSYDNSLFSVSSTPTVGNELPYITITCLKEFDKDQIIKAIASSENPDGTVKEKVIGVIKVCKNSRVTNREELKIVFVKVITDINNDGNLDIFPVNYPLFRDPDFISVEEEKQLKNTLYQALIYKENIMTSIYTLDMSGDERFKKDGTNTYYRKVIATPSDEYLLDQTDEMQKYLIDELKVQQPQYNDFLKVFVFAVKGITENNFELGGKANGMESKSCAIYKGRSVSTLAHEILHAIGLHHTHDNNTSKDDDIEPNQKYTYHYGLTDPEKSTDNIMSYGSGKKTTWKWQWKILKSILNKL
jgi:hypothetical protein